jgi:hypothetical protein
MHWVSDQRRNRYRYMTIRQDVTAVSQEADA